VITPTQLGRSAAVSSITRTPEPDPVCGQQLMMRASAKKEPHEILLEPRRQLLALCLGDLVYNALLIGNDLRGCLRELLARGSESSEEL